MDYRKKDHSITILQDQGILTEFIFEESKNKLRFNKQTKPINITESYVYLVDEKLCLLQLRRLSKDMESDYEVQVWVHTEEDFVCSNILSFPQCKDIQILSNTIEGREFTAPVLLSTLNRGSSLTILHFDLTRMHISTTPTMQDSSVYLILTHHRRMSAILLKGGTNGEHDSMRVFLYDSEMKHRHTIEVPKAERKKYKTKHDLQFYHDENTKSGLLFIDFVSLVRFDYKKKELQKKMISIPDTVDFTKATNKSFGWLVDEVRRIVYLAMIHEDTATMVIVNEFSSSKPKIETLQLKCGQKYRSEAAINLFSFKGNAILLVYKKESYAAGFEILNLREEKLLHVHLGSISDLGNLPINPKSLLYYHNETIKVLYDFENILGRIATMDSPKRNADDREAEPESEEIEQKRRKRKK
eukprot:TRINITY_DN2482_c0_g2_i4.p1 TRINITY_DN2482_c0_g2~~TRINITY_DN2482_c0_g2_i4.p1  ORF type:complete len:414 (+),score=25.22 TRINITY_DN2482_c0_g2_i4:159-1400(+)